MRKRSDWERTVKNEHIFDEKQELERLNVQNRLFKPYEQPVYDRVLAQYKHPILLDIGSNDGNKTVDRFSSGMPGRVIGLEYHDHLARQAQAAYGDGVFSFHQCDVEAPDFPERLSALMEREGVAGFDLIHLSFVLMHLKDPGGLLRTLRRFLAPGGRLILMEALDGGSRLSPDPVQRFRAFLDILSLDPLAGDRACGEKAPALLERCGYRDVTVEDISICAGAEDVAKKRALFDIFFSYLPEDIRLLQRGEPDNVRYASCGAWLAQHYDTLQNAVLSRDSELSIGIRAITCLGG